MKKRLRAIELRLQGKSYSQIKRVLRVGKSTLSLWLRRYPLSEERLRELRDFNEQRIERFRNTMRAKREKRCQEVYLREKKDLLPLTGKELFVAGLFLYWGEGGKTSRFGTSLSNTDPRVVKFFLYWLTNILKVPREKVVVRLHLYADMNERIEMDFWSSKLGLPLTQFKKPYIKKTTLRGLTYKTFGHGTCNLIVGGRDLTERVLMGIKVIADKYA